MLQNQMPKRLVANGNELVQFNIPERNLGEWETEHKTSIRREKKKSMDAINNDFSSNKYIKLKLLFFAKIGRVV